MVQDIDKKSISARWKSIYFYLKKIRAQETYIITVEEIGGKIFLTRNIFILKKGNVC